MTAETDRLIRVELNGKYGYVDTEGEAVFPFKYDDAESFSNGFAKVELNGKCGFIDRTMGKVIH
jgi:hypothetical protein